MGYLPPEDVRCSMHNLLKKYRLSLISFGLTVLVLAMVQWKVENPMILVERFLPGSGWGMIAILGFYAFFLIHKMEDPAQSAIWRRRSWTLFSLVFFSQLIIGLSGYEKFLMNPEKLHFPIPALIIAGPVYRGQISFMTILFLSTVVLVGPAWCSQLCYFGAVDNLVAAKSKLNRKAIKGKWIWKQSILWLIVVSALLMRIFAVPLEIASALAAFVGLTGAIIIFVLSRNDGKMIHCTVYCPVGTAIRYLKLLNPFRMRINTSCDQCMACTRSCHYDALNLKDIQKKVPASTCTLCGDCVSTCHSSAIEYKFLGLSPKAARNLWLVLTISIHTIFLGLARL